MVNLQETGAHILVGRRDPLKRTYFREFLQSSSFLKGWGSIFSDMNAQILVRQDTVLCIYCDNIQTISCMFFPPRCEAAGGIRTPSYGWLHILESLGHQCGGSESDKRRVRTDLLREST